MLQRWIPKTLNSYSSVLELRDYSKNQKTSLTKKAIRSSVKIAIIDDEKFKAHGNLTTYGYEIREIPDIRNLDEIHEFDVVLCDLMGVGNNFDHSIGGASIIREIKENYPTKYVIAYTGARANSAEANAAKEYADDFLKKDAEITKWVERLDDAIDIASNPYERWLLTRQGLIDEEVDIRRIIELEDAYVASIKSRDTSFANLNSVLENVDLSGNAKGIVQSLIASGIWALVFAA